MSLVRFSFALFCGFLLFATLANAANCKLGTRARCIMCNDQELLCDNNLEGWAQGSSKADTIDITVHTPSGKDLTYQFENPSKGITSYAGDLSQNPEIINYLKTQAGITIVPGMQVHMGDVFFRTPPPMTKDALGHQGQSSAQSAQSAGSSTGTSGGKPANGDSSKLRCLYDQGTASVAKGASCGGTAICVGPVTCMQSGKIVAKGQLAGCKSKNGVCPSASECASDPNITVDTAPTSSGGDLTPSDVSKQKGVVQ